MQKSFSFIRKTEREKERQREGERENLKQPLGPGGHDLTPVVSVSVRFL